MTRSRLVIQNMVVGAGYSGAALLGLRFASIHPSATAVWPPTGIAIAAFLLLGRGIWPAIFLGAFAVNAMTAGSIWTSLGIATGNTLEGAIGAALVTRFAHGASAFDRASDAFRFAIAALVSTLISPAIGVTTLAVGGYAPWPQYGSIWTTWWLGDISGALLVAPLIVLWGTVWRSPIEPERRFEATLAILSVAATAVFVFGGPVSTIANHPIAFVCLPPLVWVAFRFGPRETATATFTLATIAIWGTVRGFGPFSAFTSGGPLVLQAYLGTLAVTTMVIAAAVSDARRGEIDRERLLDAEQEARREAEAANRTKDQFLAMLGHELRNPLAAISSAVHVTQRAMHLEGNAAAAQEIIGRQLAHLNRLVDDLLDATRIATGKIVLERRPVELASLIAHSIEAMSAAGFSKQHRIEFLSQSVWVNGDPTRLEQIVVNLLSNALKYTPPEGGVRVTLRADHMESTITVVDTGIGIDQDLLPHIFDLFAQGPRGLDRSIGGLGIGLSLVKHLVELHGGKVQALSAGRNTGSTFIVSLPVLQPAEMPEAGEPRADALPPPPSGRRILIVEDQADVREMLRLALEDAGHEVFEAANGPAGVEAARRYRPEAAIVDIGLPVFDGFEVARQVRRLADGARPLLVALTGYGQPETRASAEAAGFDLYLVKPVDPADLSDLVLSRTNRN